MNLVNFPVVSCNMKLNKEPKLAACPRLRNSTIITKGNRKIGIVGYIKADTKQRTQPNDVIYKNEIPAIK